MPAAKYIFDTQGDDEEVILLLRAHFITNLPWIILSFILIFLPPVFIAVGGEDFFMSQFGVNLSSFNALIIIWYLFVFAYSFQNFLSWYFNIYLVTSERVVDMDFFQLLYRKISSAELTKIEDITVSMGGVSQSLFNYGNIQIQTAGEVVEFEFQKVPNPAQVQKVIEDAAERAKNNEP